MAFAWPPNGPEIEEVLGETLEKLDAFLEKTGVNVYRHTEIRVAGADESAQMAVLDEVRALYDEAVSKAELRIRAYMVEPPPHTMLFAVLQLYGYLRHPGLHPTLDLRVKQTLHRESFEMVLLL